MISSFSSACMTASLPWKSSYRALAKRMIRLASVKPELRWEARLSALVGSPSLANRAQPLPQAKTSQWGRSFLPRCVDE